MKFNARPPRPAFATTALLDRLRNGDPLSQDERTLVAACAEQPSQARARRLGERDDAIREALSLLGGGDYVRACELARRLRRYVTGPAWLLDARDGPAPDAPALRWALYRIVCASAGRMPGDRQLHAIGRGGR